MNLDTAFDFEADAGGRDPDLHSPMLRRYHRALWSKPLPGGASFDLDFDDIPHVLVRRSDHEDLWLTSDTMIPTYFSWKPMQSITAGLSDDERDSFHVASKTIGGMIVFPSAMVDRKPTINGARGLHGSIADRFDLTMECIRRYYAGETSPLGVTFDRYSSFFDLFDDFAGYTSFFLLDDLVTIDGAVEFFLPFDDFGTTKAKPADIDEYRTYRGNAMAFIAARASRMVSEALVLEL